MSKAAQTALAAALATVAIGATAEARTFTVTDRGDSEPGPCTRSDCTVREAVIAANEQRGADTIAIPGRRPISLQIESTGEDAALDGDLDITDRVLIYHPGRATATIDAEGIDRVFDIGARATLRKLTIRGGKANPIDGGGDGGGILAGDIGDGALEIDRSR